MELDPPIWDADNHYCEALDAFTRHIDQALGTRCVQWAPIEGRRSNLRVASVENGAEFPDGVEWMGADRVLFGSDWPHIEALPHPLDYLPETKPLPDDDRRKVLHDSAVELATLRPA